MPYRPEPVPPGATSPSCMFNNSTMPPRLVYESWNESTAPVEVRVVDVGEHRGVGDTEPLLDTFHCRPDRGRNGAVVLQLKQQHERDAHGGQGAP